MRRIIQRDIRLAMRSGGSWLFGLIFFALFLSLCAIALGGEASTLRPLGIPLGWLAFVFSALLCAADLFRADMEDGSCEQFKLSAGGLRAYIAARLLSLCLISLIPLILITPLITQFFGLQRPALLGLTVSLIVGLPAIAIYTTLSAALLCGQKNSGFLGVIISAPLLIPTLIFGIGAANSIAQTGLAAPELRVLLGLSVIAAALGIPATIAALSANLE